MKEYKGTLFICWSILHWVLHYIGNWRINKLLLPQFSFLVPRILLTKAFVLLAPFLDQTNTIYALVCGALVRIHLNPALFILSSSVFYVGPPKESIFLTTIYGLYFNHHYITNYISSWYFSQNQSNNPFFRGFGVLLKPSFIWKFCSRAKTILCQTYIVFEITLEIEEFFNSYWFAFTLYKQNDTWKD